MRRGRATLATLAVLAGGAVAGAPPALGQAPGDGTAPPPPAAPEGAAPVPEAGEPATEGTPPSRTFRLSRTGGTSRWAFVERATVVRARPAARARRVARLHLRTPEGTPELVLVLARREVRGRLWVRVRLPVLPNNTTGWVRRDRLSEYQKVRTHLVIDRRRLIARLERGGRTVFRARVGIGQRRWPTPRGRFYIRNRLTGFSDPIYGALAFGTSARSAVLTDWPGGGFVGIHGTNRPELLPGRVSHGCIRMRDRDIVRLDRLMPVGTPVTVR